MSTAVAPDTSTVERLDFDVKCRVTHHYADGRKESCAARANWLAVLVCDHSCYVCSPHLAQMTLDRAHRFRCGDCGTMFASFSAAIGEVLPL